MSGSSFSTDSSSPSTQVTSSEEPAHPQNVNHSPSSTGSSPITTPALARHHGAETSSEIEKDVPTPGQFESAPPPVNHLLDDSYDGSNANTPRLPPALSSKNELDKIPTDPGSFLNKSEQWQGATAEPPVAPNTPHGTQPTQQNSVPHAVSPDGPNDTARLRSARQVYGSPPETDQTLHSPTLDAASSGNLNYPRHGLPSYRQKSQDGTQSLSMSGSDSGQDTSTVHHGEIERGTLVGARREAFTEQGKRSSSRSSSGRVDRQIEATVNEAEPSANARSRKSSHVLGLFRENTAPHDAPKGSRRSKRASAEFVEMPLHEQAKGPGHANEEKDDGDATKLHQALGPSEQKASSELSPSPGPETRSIIRDQRGEESLQQLPRSTLAPDTGSRVEEDSRNRDLEDRSGSNDTTNEDDNDSKATAVLPAKLLEQIRGYHNLAPPFHDKFRSTQPRLPSSETISEAEKTMAEDVVGDGSDQKLDDPNRSSASPTDDDEDSDKEQISSALYYPHQVPSPEALQDVSIDDARKARETEEYEPQLPEPAISTSAEEPPDEVDITIQSHNKSKYLHGDLPKARIASGAEANYSQFLEGGSSSASESEYESAEEHTHPSVREDSSLTDDPDATPRASPTTRKSYLESRSRKSHRKPKPPVGAVELKPYNHQVGGHSRVFRFSKRAVCKELSNRENVFYEAIEHQHPELLKFLPRYAVPRKSLPFRKRTTCRSFCVFKNKHACVESSLT